MLLSISYFVPLLLGLFAVNTQCADYEQRIVFNAARSLVTARLDPDIMPGIVSQHTHRVVGGSNFNTTYDPVRLREATCSNLEPQADKSNYWHPMVYKVNYDDYSGDFTYSAIWGRSRIYYNFPALLSGTGPGTYVEPFPEDFQIVAGNPSKKTGGGYSQEDLSIFYYCEQDYANGTVTSQTTYSMPTVGCSLLVTKVWFASCWNGNAYNISQPTAHVQYPLLGAGLLGPNCPLGFKRRIPGILIETYYLGASEFADGPAGPWGNNGPNVPSYILSNGDTTGYGLHGDFQNGWNTTVLSQVVTECTNVDFDLSPGVSCPPLNATWSPSDAEDCLLDPTVIIPDELVGWQNPLATLPGCNLPWGNTTIKPECPGYVEPRLVGWSTLVGVEDNPTPSLSDLNNPYPQQLNQSSSSSTIGPSVATVTLTRTATATTTVTAYTCPTSPASVSPSSKSTASVPLSSTSRPLTSSSSVGTQSGSPTVQPSTGTWTSGLPTTTVVIVTASLGKRCGAAFGTRTVCGPSDACSSISSGFSTCATQRTTSVQPTTVGVTAMSESGKAATATSAVFSKRDLDEQSPSPKKGRRPRQAVGGDEL